MAVDAAIEVLTNPRSNPLTAAINVAGLLIFTWILLYFQSKLAKKLLQRIHTFGKIAIIAILTIGGLILSAFFSGQFWYFLTSMICAGIGALIGVYVLHEQKEEVKKEASGGATG
jgi:hypothetical protein